MQFCQRSSQMVEVKLKLLDESVKIAVPQRLLLSTTIRKTTKNLVESSQTVIYLISTFNLILWHYDFNSFAVLSNKF